MSERIECKTQKQCDAALKTGKIPILVGNGYFTLKGDSFAELRESSHAVLWESSHAVLRESSHAVLRESSHAVLRESSHAELRESSHAVLRESSHAVLRESSHAVLWESSHAVLWESSHAVGSRYTALHVQSEGAKAEGGVVIVVKAPKTPLEWCEFYGAKIEDGYAILYKAVDANFTSPHGICYAPGTMPKAPDWDGGKEECGGGLHFSPSPAASLQFNRAATKFVACLVKLEEIFIHPNPQYPNKVKAPCVAKPIYEVDRYGKRAAREEVAA